MAETKKTYSSLISGEHIKNWWTTSAELEAKTGATGIFKWQSHKWIVKIKLEKIIENVYIQWRCIESNMQNTDAWVGTTMNFNLEPLGANTKLLFSHEGYRNSPCREICTDGWQFVLGTSLKKYLETGIGQPYSS